MDWNLVVDIIWKVGTLLGFGWMYLSNRDKVTNSRISTLDSETKKLITDLGVETNAKMDDHTARLVRLETQSHPPTNVDVDACCAEFGQRLTAVEQAAKNVPSHDDLGKLYERMTGLEHRLGDRIETVNGAIKRIEGENAAQTRILNLVYESLVKP